MRKNILVVIFLIAGLAGGTGIGFILTVPSAEYQEGEADYWRGEYNDLQDDYNDLMDDYDDLLYNYTYLFYDFLALKSAFEDPLLGYTLPTVAEVQAWLAIDDTDEPDYNTGFWMCGDFAAMLMTRAKTMNWRMRICVMKFTKTNNSGFTDYSPFGEYGHAFNLILCQDYDSDGTLDWIYIEPQNDAIWYVSDGIDDFVHYETWALYFGALGNPSLYYWTNYYNYFA